MDVHADGYIWDRHDATVPLQGTDLREQFVLGRATTRESLLILCKCGHICSRHQSLYDECCKCTSTPFPEERYRIYGIHQFCFIAQEEKGDV